MSELMIPWNQPAPDAGDGGTPPLRSVGPAGHAVADRTGDDLTALVADAGGRFFAEVAISAARPPLVANALVAGRLVVFVAAVMWPPGRYQVDGDDRVHCDGVYIGQSIRPLRTALGVWRQRLPGRHQVGAMVVVHPDGPGAYALPSGASVDLEWAMADSAIGRLRRRLSRRRGASKPALLAMTAAMTGRAGGAPEGYR